MKASVIIPTYNRANILKLTLTSLEKQDIGRENYEIIVVDDGSVDNTREVISDFQGRIPLAYHFQEDRGYRVALARNEGIRRSKGEILIFLDSGMVVGSSFISEHYKAHFDKSSSESTCQCEKTAVIGYVYGYNFRLDHGYTSSMVDFNDPDAAIAELEKTRQYLDVREELYSVINDDLEETPVPWTIFWTTNVSVPKNTMLATGCFDEHFVSWGIEDLECAYRLQKCGVRFKLSRRACGIHYPHERDNKINYASNENNKEYFLKKHPDLPIELFMASKPLKFSMEYRSFLLHREKAASLPMYADLLTSEGIELLKNEISPFHNIIFGCQDGYLLGLCKSEAGLEVNNDLAAISRLKNPSVTVHNQIGIHTNFKDKHFKISLIAASGYALPEPFLSSLLEEAMRISNKTFWIRSSENLELSCIECQKVGDLGCGLLYRVNKRVT